MTRNTKTKFIAIAGAAGAIFMVVMLSEQAYVNHSDSNYAECKRLRQDLYHFETYRDDRPTYQTVKILLHLEKSTLGCD